MTQVVVWLNALANALGQALIFIGWLPGWLSLTLIGALSGVVMLVAFKYTSNQRAIKRARQQIRAGLLSVKLFYDSPWVGLCGQAHALVGAAKLLGLALVPILVMIVPVTLLLGQLALWYQARPLMVGEETVVTLKLDGEGSPAWPQAALESHTGIEDTLGPVRVVSQREVCWNLRARTPGLHTLVFCVDGRRIEKELAVGAGYMCVSQKRPDGDWTEALLHPREPPFPPDSIVRSIEVQYPSRSSWMTGGDRWMYWWFGISLLAGFLLRGVFKVNL